MKKKAKKTNKPTSSKVLLSKEQTVPLATSDKSTLYRFEQTTTVNNRIAISLSFATVLVFILIWTKVYKPQVIDPWSKALNLINLSMQSPNESSKSILLADAQKLLLETTTKQPYHARPWSIYGYYFIQKQMWDSAIACEKKAIELGNGGTVNQVEFEAADGLCHALTMKLSSMGNNSSDESIKLLKNAEVKGFENRCLIKLQGAVYTNLHKSDSALLYLNKAASMQPDADVYFNIALNYYRKQEKDKAVQNLNKALSINKDHQSAKQMLQEISNASK